MFVQDDWKLTSQLTINLGLRYEYERATTDSDNRNVNGFDPNASISIAPAVQAAYAANPIAQLPPSAFNVRGGLLFASDSQPGFWNADANNFSRASGFAYQLNAKTVMRGGLGVYTVPFIISGVVQHGVFSQATALIESDNLGLTFRANLANPYPAGVLTPAGASLGVNTFLGQNRPDVCADRLQKRSKRALSHQPPARAAGSVAGRGRIRRQPRVRSRPTST